MIEGVNFRFQKRMFRKKDSIDFLEFEYINTFFVAFANALDLHSEKIVRSHNEVR